MDGDGTGRFRPPWLLLVLTVAAASTDAISYLGLGRVFPANMTGNTVLLGIGIASGKYDDAARSAVALGGFVLGAAAAGAGSGGREWGRAVRLALIGELAVLAAASGWWLAVGVSDPVGATRFALIALVGVAMGVQSGAIAHLSAAVSTTYITGTWTGVSRWVARRLRFAIGTAGAGADTEREHDHRLQAIVVVLYFCAGLGAAFAKHDIGAPAILIPLAALACVVTGAALKA